MHHHVDIVSDKDVSERENCNLAALLIPEYKADKNIVQENDTFTATFSNHEDAR